MGLVFNFKFFEFSKRFMNIYNCKCYDRDQLFMLIAKRIYKHIYYYLPYETFLICFFLFLLLNEFYLIKFNIEFYKRNCVLFKLIWLKVI